MPRIVVLLGAWRRLPLMLNVFLRLLSGIIVLFLFQRKENSAGVSLFLVEESLSLAVIMAWFLWGGGAFIFLFLAVKSAFAPFHWWLVSVLSSCRREVLIWGISIHKIPVIIFFISLKIISILILLVFRLIIGALFLFRAGEVRRIIILSSRNIFSSIFLFLWLLRREGLFFLFCYCFILWGSLLRQSSGLNSVFFFIGLIGAPPLLLFQIKWMLLYPLFQENWRYVFIFILASTIAAISYVRYCFLADFRAARGARVFFMGWVLVRRGLLLV